MLVSARRRALTAALLAALAAFAAGFALEALRRGAPSAPAPSSGAAVVYLLGGAPYDRECLARSLGRLHESYLRRFPAPVVVFHEGLPQGAAEGIRCVATARALCSTRVRTGELTRARRPLPPRLARAPPLCARVLPLPAAACRCLPPRWSCPGRAELLRWARRTWWSSCSWSGARLARRPASTRGSAGRRRQRGSPRSEPAASAESRLRQTALALQMPTRNAAATTR